MIRKSQAGFTLVELLVVITIIVVLLALLAPGLDKAIRHAEKLQCASQMRVLGTGLTQGALEHQRKYPTRYTRYAPFDVYQAGYPDERPELRQYLGMKLNPLLNCPRSKAVDIDGSPSDLVQTSYSLWYGWLPTAGERIMRGLNDSWTLDGQSTRMRLLANDYEIHVLSTDLIYSGQQDRDGRLSLVWTQGASGTSTQTTSTWSGPYASNPYRGLLDNTAVYQDLSVQIYEDVKVYDEDERMTVASRGWGGSTLEWCRVPRP